MLKEADIRPDKLIEEEEGAIQADLKWLLEKRAYFINVPCPSCDSHSIDVKRSFYKYDLFYGLCSTCETVYMSPRPTVEILETFYKHSENAKFYNEHIFLASEKTRREELFNPRAQNISDTWMHNNHDYKETRVLMDIGSGFGTFLESIKYHPYGIFNQLIALEPSPAQAQTCRDKGFKVIEQPIEKLIPDFKVDCITAFEVIEHLFSPRDFVMKCNKMLNKNGLLVLTCPNIKGFDIETLGSSSGSVGFEHLNYFNITSLKTLLKDCGFEIAETRTPGKLDAELVRKKILSGEYDISNQPFLKTVLIDQWDSAGERFQQFLADNLLSSHLWMVAMKP